MDHGEARAGTHEPVDGAAFGEPVKPSECGDDGLPDYFAFAMVLDDLEILARAGFFDAEKRGWLLFRHHMFHE